MLNECIICEEMFKETKENPGCICDECREKLKNQSESDEPLPIPKVPKHYYRVK